MLRFKAVPGVALGDVRPPTMRSVTPDAPSPPAACHASRACCAAACKRGRRKRSMQLPAVLPRLCRSGSKNRACGE
jgi:hypothetical protein